MNLVFEFLTKSREREAIKLLEKGLESHWGRYDEAFNPDISDLYKSYNDSMIIGLHKNRVVSCGAWQPIFKSTAKIVRVSVSNKFQRKSFGTKLLKKMESHLFELGYKELILETASQWHGVVNFYLVNDYRVSHKKDGDTYFTKSLCN